MLVRSAEHRRNPDPQGSGFTPQLVPDATRPTSASAALGLAVLVARDFDGWQSGSHHHGGMPSVTEAEARVAVEALPGLTWRPFARDHLPTIAAFFAECERYDRNPVRQSLTGLQEFWDSPGAR